jgi:hypothetical protein
MSTEAQVSPDAETQNPAPDTETPDLVAPEAVDADAEHEAQSDEADDADKALKRMQRRIDKRTADVYRTKAENEQLKARLAELEAKSEKPEEPRDKPDPMALAREISRAERFAEKANSLVEQGTKKHADYMGALKDLAAEVGDFVRRDGTPSPFMEVVLEVSEKPTELLYHLGKNPEIAEELADLGPIKLAKRLDRIERELAEAGAKKTSNAPKPLQEVRGSAGASRALADLEDKDFVKRRREQIANRR